MDIIPKKIFLYPSQIEKYILLIYITIITLLKEFKFKKYGKFNDKNCKQLFL